MCICLVYLPYTLRKLCLPSGAQQHHAYPGWPCAQNPSAVIRQYSASISGCCTLNVKCGTVNGQIVVVYDVWYTEGLQMLLACVQAKPGHRAQTVPRQAGAINVVDHPRLSDLPERNLTYPSPSHLSVHAHQAQFSAHRSPINSHCRAYTIQIRKPDTQHDGAWGLTPRCLLRQLV